MKLNWRAVAHIAALAASAVVPGAVSIEQAAEAAIDAPTNPQKAAASLQALIQTLQAQGAITGKTYATPRVVAVLKKLNDDGVELVNALAEAHGADPTTP